MSKPLEEGYTCLDCQLDGECEELLSYSLDAHDNNPDSLCPKCHGDNIKYHSLLEDKVRLEPEVDKMIYTNTLTARLWPLRRA